MQISRPSLQSGKVGGITIGVLPDRRHCALAWDVCRYWQVLHKQLNYTLETASGSSGTCARWGSADCYGSTPGGPAAAAATMLAPQAAAWLTCCGAPAPACRPSSISRQQSIGRIASWRSCCRGLKRCKMLPGQQPKADCVSRQQPTCGYPHTLTVLPPGHMLSAPSQ